MSTLAFADLEDFYDNLATAIDKVGEKHETVFLAKLALTLANQVGDRARIDQALEIAARDLY